MRENDHVKRFRQINGRRIVMLWSGQFNGGSLIEGEWFCYKDGLFNGGGMVMLERLTV